MGIGRGEERKKETRTRRTIRYKDMLEVATRGTITPDYSAAFDGSEDSFITLSSTDLKDRRTKKSVKCHINFGSGEIEKGWNTIAPILLKYPQITKHVKIVNVNNYQSYIEKQIGDLKENLDLRLEKIKDENLAQLIKNDYQKAIASIKASEKRFLESTPVTFYIYSDNETDVKLIKQMMDEIATTLHAKGFLPGPLPASDFSINSFVSIRGDQLEDAPEHKGERKAIPKYLSENEVCLPNYWKHFQKHPIIRELVDEKAITKTPDFQPASFMHQADEIKGDLSGVVEDINMSIYYNFNPILNRIKKIVNLWDSPPFKKDFEVLFDDIKEPIQKIKSYLATKGLDPLEKFIAITHACQEAENILQRSHLKNFSEQKQSIVKVSTMFGLSSKTKTLDKASLSKLTREFFNKMSTTTYRSELGTEGALNQFRSDTIQLNKNLKQVKDGLKTSTLKEYKPVKHQKHEAKLEIRSSTPESKPDSKPTTPRSGPLG